MFLMPTGWLFDITQGYEVPFCVTGSIQVAGGLLILLVSFMKTRVKQQEMVVENTEVENKETVS